VDAKTRKRDAEAILKTLEAEMLELEGGGAASATAGVHHYEPQVLAKIQEATETGEVYHCYLIARH
jgi:hypothetical protein